MAEGAQTPQGAAKGILRGAEALPPYNAPQRRRDRPRGAQTKGKQTMTTAQTTDRNTDTATQSGGFPLRAINAERRDPRDLLRDVAEAAAAASIFS